MTLVPASSRVGIGAPTLPFASTAGNDVTILTDSSGHSLISGGDDSSGARLKSPDGNNQLTVENGGIIASTGLTGLAVTLNTIGGDCVTCGNSGAAPTLKFYGGAGVVQPAATDIATALQTVGLVAAGTLGAALAGGVKTGQQTSGALSTLALVSGAGQQISTASDRETVTPLATDGTANAATCQVQLSPDNVTYSTLITVTASVAVNTVGSVTIPVNVRVPAGWYLKLTASHATIGTTTYW